MLKAEEKKGFTIIELVIAVSILSAAVIGIFSAFSVMVVLTSDASDRLLAAYLAQEGMEIVRNIRDTNWLNPGDDTGDPTLWRKGLDGCSEEQGGCMADYRTTGAAISQLVPYIDSEYLKIDNAEGADGFYNQTFGADTKFKRKITITFVENIVNPDDLSYIAKVLVQVFWNQKSTILNPGGSQGVIETEENLYDWY